MKDDNLKTWPDRIWLQHGEEEMPHFDARYLGVEDITWCQDSVEPHNVEYIRADLITELERQNAELVKDAQAKQAEIDRLMLEYCPSEMTPEQLEEWGKHQRKVAAPHQQSDACRKDCDCLAQCGDVYAYQAEQQSDAEAAQSVKDHLDSLTVYGKDPKQSDEKGGAA